MASWPPGASQRIGGRAALLGLWLLGCGRLGFEPLELAGAETVRAVATGEFHTCAIIGGGALLLGANADGQLGLGDTADRISAERVGGRVDWVDVAAGNRHTCGVTAGGVVDCWGGNPNGQLGLGDDQQRNLGRGRSEARSEPGVYLRRNSRHRLDRFLKLL